MFHQWRVALKLACKQKMLIDGQMVHHNKRVKQGCLREWKKFTLKSRAEKHCNKKITLKVRICSLGVARFGLLTLRRSRGGQIKSLVTP